MLYSVQETGKLRKNNGFNGTLLLLFFRIPCKTYMIIAFLTVGTMGLSNTSLGYLNYPTQVIFKCCKLIPVMIGGVFIQGTFDARFIFIFIHNTYTSVFVVVVVVFPAREN